MHWIWYVIFVLVVIGNLGHLANISSYLLDIRELLREIKNKQL